MIIENCVIILLILFIIINFRNEFIIYFIQFWEKYIWFDEFQMSEIWILIKIKKTWWNSRELKDKWCLKEDLCFIFFLFFFTIVFLFLLFLLLVVVVIIFFVIVNVVLLVIIVVFINVVFFRFFLVSQFRLRFYFYL